MSPEPPPRPTYPTSDSELPGIPSKFEVAPNVRGSRRVALGVLLLLSFLSVARLAAPLWVGIAFGTVMAFTAQPAFRKLSLRLKERRALAAAITTIVTGVVCTLAVAVTVYVLSREMITLVAVFQAKLETHSLRALIGDRATAILAHMGISEEAARLRLEKELETASGLLASAAGLVLQTASEAILGLIMGLMAMYYVLMEWPNIPVRLERLLPLEPRHTRALVLELRNVGRSALIGTFATALVQGLLGGVGYAIVGVPQAVTWGLLTALGSFLPVVGTAIVWVPVAIYLVIAGHIVSAVMMVLWGLIVVMALSDYVIRPRLVGSGQGHPFLMLVAILGGIEVFGLAGLIMGVGSPGTELEFAL